MNNKFIFNFRRAYNFWHYGDWCNRIDWTKRHTGFLLKMVPYNCLRRPFAIGSLPIPPSTAPPRPIIMTSYLNKQLCAILSPTSSPQHTPRNYSTKAKLDRSLVPTLNEDELEEQYIKGSGPGGSKVNKTAACVRLTHKPTGITVKCLDDRDLHHNRKIAREMLIEKLDDHFNGDQSLNAQKKRILEKKNRNQIQKTRKLNEMKAKLASLIAE